MKSAGVDPADPISPYVARTLVNDGTGYLTLPKAPLVKGESLDPDGLRFNLPEWTLCAMVRLTDVPADDVIVVQRRVEVGDQSYLNYELGIARDTLVPYIRFQSASGIEYRVDGYRPLQLNAWTHIGGRFGKFQRSGTQQLALLQDFTAVARDLSGIFCVTGVQDGDLVIGKNLIGELDEVSVWKEARNNDQIEALRGATLLFGKKAARAESLTGHCCERPEGNIPASGAMTMLTTLTRRSRAVQLAVVQNRCDQSAKPDFQKNRNHCRYGRTERRSFELRNLCRHRWFGKGAVLRPSQLHMVGRRSVRIRWRLD